MTKLNKWKKIFTYFHLTWEGGTLTIVTTPIVNWINTHICSQQIKNMEKMSLLFFINNNKIPKKKKEEEQRERRRIKKYDNNHSHILLIETRRRRRRRSCEWEKRKPIVHIDR